MHRLLVLIAFAALTASSAFGGYCPFQVVNYNPEPATLVFDACSDCGKGQVAGNGGVFTGTIAPNYFNYIAYGIGDSSWSCYVNTQAQGFVMLIGVDGQCMIKAYLPCNAKAPQKPASLRKLKPKD